MVATRRFVPGSHYFFWTGEHVESRDATPTGEAH